MPLSPDGPRPPAPGAFGGEADMPPALRKNLSIEAEIEDVAADGTGIARFHGLVVFVKGAAPGDRAVVHIEKVGKNAAYGKVRRLLVPSPDRITPDCPAYPLCGGCRFRHIAYEAELKVKVRRVEEALRRIGGAPLRCERVFGAAQPDRYRNKAVIPIGMKDGRPAAGFYRERSHDIIPVSDCLLHPGLASRAAGAVLSYIRGSGAPVYDEATGRGLVRRVFVRSSRMDGSALVTVVAAGILPAPDALVREILGACPETAGVVLNINKSRGNAVLGKECVCLWGRPYLEDSLLGLVFRISPLSFFQVNPAQAEILYSRAIFYAGLDGDQTVLDLYCGTGTITLCMAKHARLALGAEISQEAVADAEENARRNGIRNARFFCADAGQAARRLLAEHFRPDVIVTDPPRKGMDEETVRAIKELAPARLVYISCDPCPGRGPPCPRLPARPPVGRRHVPPDGPCGDGMSDV